MSGVPITVPTITVVAAVAPCLTVPVNLQPEDVPSAFLAETIPENEYVELGVIKILDVATDVAAVNKDV